MEEKVFGMSDRDPLPLYFSEARKFDETIGREWVEPNNALLKLSKLLRTEERTSESGIGSGSCLNNFAKSAFSIASCAETPGRKSAA